MTERSPQKFTNAHVLATAAALFVPMAILLAKGVAPLFALAAISVAAVELHRRRTLPLLSGPVLYLMAGLAGWALLSWWWSTAPDETVKTGLSLALTFLGGAVLIGAAARFDAREQEIFRTGVIVGGAVGFALIAFEFATDAWLAQYLYGLKGKKLFLVEERHTAAMNPGLAATALFFWTWALAVRARFPGAAANIAIAVAFALILLGNADAVVVSLVAGAVIFGAALALPRIVPWILAAVIAAGVAMAPLVPSLLPNPLEPGARPAWMTPSAAHRIVIWKNTIPYIAKNPVLGRGFDTARSLYGVADIRQYALPGDSRYLPWTVQYEPIPLHPHNGVLQVWLELGLAGALILLGLLLTVIRAITAGVDERTRRAGALAMVTTALTIASISFGAWQSWWLASMLLAAAFLAAVTLPAVGAAAALGEPAAATPAAPVIPAAREIGGPKGPEPTRYGDWEHKGRAIDF
ncbi:MAG: DUF1674 domain-containing protein [Rhodospirillales bacterium]|nr:DUF1674 domain-containing protein [Rhodospirillales bacterium]